MKEAYDLTDEGKQDLIDGQTKKKRAVKVKTDEQKEKDKETRLTNALKPENIEKKRKIILIKQADSIYTKAYKNHPSYVLEKKLNYHEKLYFFKLGKITSLISSSTDEEKKTQLTADQ